MKKQAILVGTTLVSGWIIWFGAVIFDGWFSILCTLDCILNVFSIWLMFSFSTKYWNFIDEKCCKCKFWHDFTLPSTNLVNVGGKGKGRRLKVHQEMTASTTGVGTETDGSGGGGGRSLGVARGGKHNKLTLSAVSSDVTDVGSSTEDTRGV